MTERNDLPETPADHAPSEMHVNDYGSTKDSAVVVEEPTRTVLLTDDETLVFEKEPRIEIAPANRPRRVYGGMWGSAEIGAAGVSAMALLAAILLYLFAVVPSNREVEHNRVESDRLQEELTSANIKYGDFTSAETQAAKLINSVNDFQTYLPVAAVGKNTLYQRINGLIGSYGLVNSTGPDYTYLDAADQSNGKQTDEERGRSKFRSLFPGVYVTMTLEGSYQNLRRFINDVERGGNDFVVISSIELEPSDNSQAHPQTTDGQSNSPNAARPTLNGQIYGGVINPGSGKMMTPNSPNYGMVNPTTGRPMNQSQFPGTPTNPVQQQFPQQQPSGPHGKAHGETVSLRIELAAYFRRPVLDPVVTAADPAKGLSQ